MQLKSLLKEFPEVQVKGARDIEIHSVSSHSKKIGPGGLFIAKKGKMQDGQAFIKEAIRSGACAVLTDYFDPSLKITQLIHPVSSELEAKIAAYFNGDPSKKLFMIGVTGTNGKTTTAYLVRQLLDQTFGPCGLIGTIEYHVGTKSYHPTHTTPDVTTNHKLLKEMIQSGCRSCCMEVTSHALDQKRVGAIDFDIALFTNLSQDHLDYHKTMEHYAESKASLFQSLTPDKKKQRRKKWAIVNSDSPWEKVMTHHSQVPRMTFGIEKKADLFAHSIHLTPNGTETVVTWNEKKYSCFWPIVGRFNVLNCFAAMSVLLSQNISMEKIISLMETLKPVPGRLESIENSLGLQIFVDFAHSEDALDKVLTCLNEFTRGKVIVVFGCGGDRDSGKRAKMAQIAERKADLSIVTTDNPRSEDPEAIIHDICQGFTDKKSYIIEVDRRQALLRALSFTDSQDILLIAGRGHEPYQCFSHHTIEFDDRKVIKEILDEM